MPAINFPDSPTTGQVHTASNKSWSWDGSKWLIRQYNNAVDEDVTEYIDDEIATAKKQAFALAFVMGT